MKKKNTGQNKKDATKENPQESIRFIEKAEELQEKDGKDRFDKACEIILGTEKRKTKKAP
jgi:hypothetical protein